MRKQSIFNFKKLMRTSLRKQASKQFYPTVPASATAWIPALALLRDGLRRLGCVIHIDHFLPTLLLVYSSQNKTRARNLLLVWWPEFETQNLHGGRWELTPANCPLTSKPLILCRHPSCRHGCGNSKIFLSHRKFPGKKFKGNELSIKISNVLSTYPYHNILLI